MEKNREMHPYYRGEDDDEREGATDVGHCEHEDGHHDAGHGEHGECCEDCKRTCRRNFWTEVLRAFVKIGSIVLAACGLQGFAQED